MNEAQPDIEFFSHIPTAVGAAMTRSRREQTAVVACLTWLPDKPIAVLTEALAKEQGHQSIIVTYDCGTLVMPPDGN